MSHRVNAWGPGPSLPGWSDRSESAVGWRWSFASRTPHSNVNPDEDSGQCPTGRSKKMARVEAVLLVADGAMSFRKLAQFATLADVAEARALVNALNEAFDVNGSAFRVEHVAGGCRLMTRPQYALWLDRLHNRQAQVKLSPPMLETLSIVACQQPVTRAEVEKVRGVQSSEMLKQLMERGLIRITGEDDSLGRPFLYGTTRQFLEEFGLGNLDDLPVDEGLRRKRERQTAEEAAVDEAAIQTETPTGDTSVAEPGDHESSPPELKQAG